MTVPLHQQEWIRTVAAYIARVYLDRDAARREPGFDLWHAQVKKFVEVMHGVQEQVTKEEFDQIKGGWEYLREGEELLAAWEVRE